MTNLIKRLQQIRGGTSSSLPTRGWLCFSALAMLLLVGQAPAAPVVSGHIKVLVPAGGALTDLISFPMPAPCAPQPCADHRVMEAKFLVDETVAPDSFELRSTTSPLAKYPSIQFSTLDANVSVRDSDLPAGLDEVATARASILGTASPGYRILLLRVRFTDTYDGFPAGEIWKIQAKANGSADHFYGFKVDGAMEAAAEPLITKPYLIQYIAPASLTNFASFVDLVLAKQIDFGEVHVNLPDEYAPKEYWEFRNVGTDTLRISAVNPFPQPAGAFNVENYPSPPSQVPPMDAFQKTVTFKPIVQGAASIPNISLTSNAGNVTLGLQGKGIILRSSILLDISGSMADGLDLNYTSDPTKQKIAYARNAALEMAEIYNQILPKAQLSLFTYPNLLGQTASSQQLIGLSAIEGTIDAYRKRFNPDLLDPGLVKPTGGTPMAAGIAKVWEVLYPKPANTRSAVFQIGDGDHNENSPPPKATPADWYNSADFQTKSVPFFTVPYGVLGSLTTFTQLAARSGGEKFPANLSITDVNTRFKKALGKALDLETLMDPAASITAGADKEHAICVGSSAYQLVFSVHWEDQDANALRVSIETPYRTLLTSSSPSVYPKHVGYSSGRNYADFVVRGRFLRGDSGTGTWKIHVHGNKGTPYVYQVYAMDRMKPVANLDKWGTLGMAGELTLKYPSGPYSLATAATTVSIDRPTASFNNYLARTPVTPELIARIPDSLAREWGPAQKKYFALSRFADKPFQDKRAVDETHKGDLEANAFHSIFEKKTRPSPTQRISAAGAQAAGASQSPLEQAMSGATGLFTEKAFRMPLEAVAVEGLYQITVSVLGITSKAECFEREYTFSQVIGLALDKTLLAGSIKWEEAAVKPFFPKEVVAMIQEPLPEGKVRKAVTFHPRDAAGNDFGMGRGSEVKLAVAEAEAMGPMVDNYDGSYTQVVQYARGGHPTVQAAIGDIQTDPIPAEPKTTSPAIPWWSWILLALFLVLLILWLRRPKP